MREELALWCVREVNVQYDRIEDVEPLYNAFVYAEARRKELWDAEAIMRIGARVKPFINKDGWRRFPVFMGYNAEGAPWREIPRLMDQLGVALKEGVLSPHDWFVEFETIHPFGDGNGRTGAIVANILMGKQDKDLLLSYEVHSFQNVCEVCGK
jgi:hypothetical protein